MAKMNHGQMLGCGKWCGLWKRAINEEPENVRKYKRAVLVIWTTTLARECKPPKQADLEEKYAEKRYPVFRSCDQYTYEDGAYCEYRFRKDE